MSSSHNKNELPDNDNSSKDDDVLNNPAEEIVEQLRSMLKQRQSEENYSQELSDAQENIRFNRFINWVKEKFSHKNNERLQSLGDVETETNSNPQTDQPAAIPKARPLYPFLEEETPTPAVEGTIKKQTDDSVHYLRDVPKLNDLIHSDRETSDTLKRIIAEFDEQDSQDEVKNSDDNDSRISDEEFEPDYLQNDPFTSQENEEGPDLDQAVNFNTSPFKYSDIDSPREHEADDWQSLIDNALKDIKEKSIEDDFVFPFVLDDTDQSENADSTKIFEEALFEEDVEPETQEPETQEPEIQEDEAFPQELEETSGEFIDTPTTEADKQQADIISSLRENLKEEYDKNDIEDTIAEETQIDSILSSIKRLIRTTKESFQKLSSRDKKIVYIAILLSMVIVISMITVLLVNPSIPSRDRNQALIPVQPTATVDLSVYPTGIKLPGGWFFVLQEGFVNNDIWEPKAAEWLSGTTIRRVISIPWSKQTEAYFLSLENGQDIQLFMSNSDIVHYNVEQFYQVDKSDINLMTSSEPSLAVILSQPEAEQRWVLICKK